MKHLLLLCLLAPLAACHSAAAPFLEKIDLCKNGDDGYVINHIPGVVVTARGTVLCWWEARKRQHDWAAIDILMRRSTDDGRSFSAARKIADVPGPKAKNPAALRLKSTDPREVTYNNPVIIADRDGTVHMLFCLEYMRCFYQRSTDDGLSFSKPVEITGVFEKFRPFHDWKVLATGPDHGIQLQNGRLIVPVWLSDGTGGNAHRPSVTATIYSDDHGATWKAGDVAVPNTPEWINPNETAAVQLADGRVMLNVRNESPAHRRLVTISPDGATRWSTPKFDPALLEPICMAGLVRLSTTTGSDKNRILFSNPNNLESAKSKGPPAPGKSRDRKNLSIRLSYDEAATWPVCKTLEPGTSAYSDLAVTKSGAILCFYGRAELPTFAGDRLTLARFNLPWLTDGKDALK